MFDQDAQPKFVDHMLVFDHGWRQGLPVAAWLLCALFLACSLRFVSALRLRDLEIDWSLYCRLKKVRNQRLCL